MYTLYLLSYNNYYNRIVKKENSVADYLAYLVTYKEQDTDPNGNKATIQKVNFVAADYVNTEQVVNWQGDLPDYLIVADEAGQEIDSRWFVVGAEKTRGGQLLLTLHRDLVVDFYDETISAPCFVEKATPKSIEDPAIFNKEDMSFNQIKTSETPLSDETGVAWIVGFMPRNAYESAQQKSTDYLESGSEDISVDRLTNWEWNKYVSNDFIPYADSWQYVTKTSVAFGSSWSRGGRQEQNITKTYIDKTGAVVRSEYVYRYIVSGGTSGSSYTYYPEDGPSGPNYTSAKAQYPCGLNIQTTGNHATDPTPDAFTNFPSNISAMNSDAPAVLGGETQARTNSFFALNNQVLLDRSSGIYYRVSIVEVGSRSSVSVPVSSGLGTKWTSALNRSLGTLITFNVNPDSGSYSLELSGAASKIYRLRLDQQYSEAKVTVRASNARYHLDDSPYDMFCLPYPTAENPNFTIKKNGTTMITTPSRGAALAVANEILAGLSSADLQLLPYCPVRYCIKSDGSFDVGDSYCDFVTASVGGSGTHNVSVLLWATTSRLDIRKTIQIPQKSTVLEKKVASETDVYRLNSPNYAGIFEFNPQMNKGVQSFRIQCNYIPYGSYIHVAPAFDGLYGYDANDARGLICGGDFSLPRTTDAWEQYKLNNATYQQVFDRQIQNLEVNNAVQKEREQWQAAAGVASAAAGGFAAGAQFGGTAGLVAGGLGALLAGGLSAAAAQKDMQLNDRLRNEALDYKQDMFGYQLQAIQAIPQSIARTTAITINNKIFPFIEYYTCTEIEKQALRDKIQYNGMTIMRIARLRDFLQQGSLSYMKGRLIRLDLFPEDFHLAKALADEIYKGVFI